MHEKPDLRIAVLVGVTLAFIIAIGNLYWQMEHVRAEMVNLRQSILTEASKLTQAASQAAGNNKRSAAVEPSRKILDSWKEELAEELTSAKRQATAAALHAKAEAVSHADKLAEQIGQERQSQHKEVVGELGQIKQNEASTSAKIDDVTADIATIRNEVASTRSEL